MPKSANCLGFLSVQLIASPHTQKTSTVMHILVYLPDKKPFSECQVIAGNQSNQVWDHALCNAGLAAFTPGHVPACPRRTPLDLELQEWLINEAFW